MFEVVVDTQVKLGGEEKTVRVAVRRRELDEYGLVCDFHEIRGWVREHAGRNNTPSDYLQNLHEHLAKKCENKPFWLSGVEVSGDR